MSKVLFVGYFLDFPLD